MPNGLKAGKNLFISLTESVVVKRLAIISDCVHTRKPDGAVGTENHIFVKQMEALSRAFREVVLCCPFVPFSESLVLSTYREAHIQFIELPDAGGNRLRDKWRLLKTVPIWWGAFKAISRRADVVYQRFPNNLNIPGFFFFYFKKAKVFATYTGTWKNYNGEPATYRLQKWLLRKYFRGPVFAYLEAQPQQQHLISSFSPSYSVKQWDGATPIVAAKVERLRQGVMPVPVFITVGALTPQKNQQYILETFKRLHEMNVDYVLYVAGSGILREDYLRYIVLNGLQSKVFLTGQLSQDQLQEYYGKSDFVIQASLVEGFGKVPLEGFFYGVIPILNNVTLAKEMTGDGVRGYLFDAKDRNALLILLQTIYAQHGQRLEMIQEGRKYALKFTLESWVQHYFEVLHDGNE